jgi:Glycosyltransferase family 87
VPLRWRATAAALVCALHLALFVPTIGDWSSILVNDFAPQAEAIKDGELPYRDQEIEYPPLSIPVLIAPAYFDDSTQGFVDGFMWEMLAFDLAIVVLIALALPGDARRVLGAIGIYTAGLVVLSGVVLDRSLIDYGPLALDRFDLVPTLCVLAAVLARDRARSATWSALLSVGVAIKAFPLFLYPALLRGERSLRRVIVAGAIPLILSAAAVIVMGDEFGSAITYHTERTLQVESLGASAFEVAHLLGVSGVATGVGHGGFEITASGATAARWLSVVLGAAGYLWLVSAGWRSRATNFELVSALLAVLVAFAPVLSPQFLLWLLPVSACAYGLGKENVVLLAVLVLTQVELQHYDGVDGLAGSFVWPLAARNALLLVYLALVAVPILRAGGREEPDRPLATPEPALDPQPASPKLGPSALLATVPGPKTKHNAV